MKKYLLIIILFCISNLLKSQIVDLKKDKLWVDFGIGTFRSGTYTTNPVGFYMKINNSLSLNYSNDKILFRTNINHCYEKNFLFNNNLVKEDFTTFSIMVGKGISKKYGQFYFLTGLGLTSGSKREKATLVDRDFFGNIYNSKEVFIHRNFVSVALPLEFEYLFKPSKYFGLGISYFQDLNFDTTIHGFRLKFAFGKLR